MEPVTEENKTEWVLHGVPEDDPKCIHTVQELIDYINQVGFLPLFKNEIPGYSVEEKTVSTYWWSGNRTRDPWEWREIIAGTGEIAYGKFFHKKAGFISKEWLPYFCNYRRKGYDFSSLWEDGLAGIRQKRIMDLFKENSELFSCEAKKLAGFGKGGEKNFEGIVTELQMMLYLCVRDFRQRINKKGEEFGWHIAVYSTPEQIWGHDFITSGYAESPKASAERIYQNFNMFFPGVEERNLQRVLG